MEVIEVIIWIFFIAATVVFNLVQKWKRKADRRAEALHGRVDEAQDTARHAEQVARERTQAARERTREAIAKVRRTATELSTDANDPARSSHPAPLSAQGWGRHDEPLPEDVLEAAPLPLPPVTPQRPPAPAPLAEIIRRERAAPAPRSVHPHRPFRTPQEVRQGIIAMTVLGPCRAMDPYDMGQGDGAR